MTSRIRSLLWAVILKPGRFQSDFTDGQCKTVDHIIKLRLIVIFLTTLDKCTLLILSYLPWLVEKHMIKHMTSPWQELFERQAESCCGQKLARLPVAWAVHRDQYSESDSTRLD